MTRKQFLESIETWKTDDINVKYVYGDNHIELTYHDQTAVGEDILKIQVSYCPMCGRRLAEK